MSFLEPIDLVYTWVDGNCPDYQKLCSQYTDSSIDLNPERYRDQYHLLRYSLRSVEKYVSWIGNIYIFTCRPQVPDWLDTSHPRIRLVHHDQVIDQEYLPTFNCNVIESYLHLIPSISDYFLYVNDDFLFGNLTNRDDFITDEGQIKVLGTLFGEKLRFRIYEKRGEIVSLGLIEHTPLLIYKPYWQTMLEERALAVTQTRRNRFRTDNDLKMDKLYRYFLVSHPEVRKRVVPIYELLQYHRFHKITNNYNLQNKKLATINRIKPKFYCLNDDQRSHPDPEVVRLVQDFLHENYPDKSQYEKYSYSHLI